MRTPPDVEGNMIKEQEVIDLFFRGHDIDYLTRIIKRKERIKNKEARRLVEVIILHYYNEKKYL